MAGLTLYLLAAAVMDQPTSGASGSPPSGGMLLILIGFYSSTQIHAGERRGFATGFLYTGLSVGVSAYALLAPPRLPSLTECAAGAPFLAMFLYCGYRLFVRKEAGDREFYAHPSLVGERTFVPKAEETFQNSPSSPAKPVDRVGELERLAALRTSGLLTAEEFSRAKREVLEGDGHA